MLSQLPKGLKQEDPESQANLGNLASFYTGLGMLFSGRVLVNHAGGPWLKPQYCMRDSLATNAQKQTRCAECATQTVQGTQ